MLVGVSANVPTKRELKVVSPSVKKITPLSFSKCPYEEGTERNKMLFMQITSVSFSKCPYEEGTERNAFFSVT